MFIQVIEGHTRDGDALERQLDVWEEDLSGGAIGYLGSTGGVTASGDAILIARFTDEAAAKANSSRPEQAAWWGETEACFDGPVTFHNTTDVTEMRHGDRNQAGFVQVMEGTIADRERIAAREEESNQMLAETRPDLLGTTTAYFDDGGFTELAYFTSEDSAREAENRELSGEAAEMVSEWERAMKVDRYLDLTHPLLIRV